MGVLECLHNYVIGGCVGCLLGGRRQTIAAANRAPNITHAQKTPEEAGFQRLAFDVLSCVSVKVSETSFKPRIASVVLTAFTVRIISE